MCDFSQGFRLCTCSDETALHKENYHWRLYRYIGKQTKRIVGKYRPPMHDIGAGLSGNFVLLQLHETPSCFDFEYQAQEGDNLVLYDRKNMRRLEFIFRNNSWEETYYAPFKHIKEQLCEGKIEK